MLLEDFERWEGSQLAPVHAITPQAMDPVAWMVNVIIAGCAALLAVSLLRASRKVAAPAPQPAE